MPQQPEGFQNPSGPPQGSYPPPGGYPGAPAPYPQMPYGPPGAPYAPYGYGVDAYGRPLSDKSKLTAGLLEIFLGGFGVGRFYLGYTGIGVAQIAATWLTCGIGAIWPLIDGIMMLTGRVPDAEGRTLRE
jgi:TM2 domain-containing membrane protein YozV